MAEKSELNVKMNFDCEDAIKGIKAFRRELNGTLKDVKELQAVMNGSGAHFDGSKIDIHLPDGYKVIRDGEMKKPEYRFYVGGILMHSKQFTSIGVGDLIKVENVEYQVVSFIRNENEEKAQILLFEKARLDMADQINEEHEMNELQYQNSIGNIEWIEYKK